MQSKTLAYLFLMQYILFYMEATISVLALKNNQLVTYHCLQELYDIM